MGMPLQQQAKKKVTKKAAKKRTSKKKTPQKVAPSVVEYSDILDDNTADDRPLGYIRSRFTIALDSETAGKLKQHFQRQNEVRTQEQLISDLIRERLND